MIMWPVILEMANSGLVPPWKDLIPGKWLHFYLYARKYRVWKKYRRMIRRRIAELGEAVQIQQKRFSEFFGEEKTE